MQTVIVMSPSEPFTASEAKLELEAGTVNSHRQPATPSLPENPTLNQQRKIQIPLTALPRLAYWQIKAY